MTDKLLIDRELLERAVKADASNGASSVDLVDGWKAMEQIRAILAAPRQPEGGIEPDITTHGYPAYSVEQHHRAIAELREECERVKSENDHLARHINKMINERDTLRQQLDERDAEITGLKSEATKKVVKITALLSQREKLAGLLDEVTDDFVVNYLDADLIKRIDAALAEVEP